MREPEPYLFGGNQWFVVSCLKIHLPGELNHKESRKTRECKEPVRAGHSLLADGCRSLSRSRAARTSLACSGSELNDFLYRQKCGWTGSAKQQEQHGVRCTRTFPGQPEWNGRCVERWHPRPRESHQTFETNRYHSLKPGGSPPLSDHWTGAARLLQLQKLAPSEPMTMKGCDHGVPSQLPCWLRAHHFI